MSSAIPTTSRLAPSSPIGEARPLLTMTGTRSVNAHVNATPYRPTTAAALIVSPDPLGGALVAAAVEMVGVRPIFLRAGERPREAIRRGRPAYVLIDCGDESASDEAVLGPAMMTGARVFLFGDANSTQRMRHVAVRFRLGTIVLPQDVDRLAAILMLPQPNTPEQVTD
jgi:hypothetical protein